jgi:hypothetical protein
MLCIYNALFHTNACTLHLLAFSGDIDCAKATKCILQQHESGQQNLLTSDGLTSTEQAKRNGKVI